MRTTFVLAALVLLLSSCEFMGESVYGSGHIVSQNRNITGFTGVRVVGDMDVVLLPGNTFNVKVETDDNLQEYVETEKEGSVLEIKERENYNLHSRVMKVYVTAPEFAQVEVVGSGNITSQGKLVASNKLVTEITGSGDVNITIDAPEIESHTTGSGNLNIAGNTRSFYAEVNGSGDVNAFNLMSEITKIEVSGSANAQVFASKQLDVDVSGSGDIEYKGNPAVNQDIAGSGSVRRVN